jgi:membrane protein required for colicin V production
MIGPLTYLDAALLAVAFISALLAMYRGFMRELLSILSWAAAGAAVLWVVFKQEQLAKDVAEQMGTNDQIAKIALGAIVFLITLIIVHLITARISDAILDSRIGMIDRILGFLFGAARGALLIIILFLLGDGLVFNSYYLNGRGEKPANIPEWVDKAKSRDAIVSTGQAIHAFCVNLYEQWEPVLKGQKPAEPEQQGFINQPGISPLALESTLIYRISKARRPGANLAS